MAENTNDEDGIGTLVSRLVEDAKAFVRAEIAVYQAKALKLVADYRTAAILCIVALILAHAAIIALLVGVIMSIAQALGPIWATVITIGGTFAIVGLLIVVALSMVRSAGRKGVSQ
ncbi:phage holin family protein [Sphingomonas sp. BAUL-RG-20F-R05-02]|uniref:phage holin family protein n=1 Tax=Sphingomonas sp. BAUL-RG-20F-R05-02 TaxID=2914830 RepID=UPI001F564E76|nr:phage holin family protein [Sphingomonas sp. BAUL-RG-20F-R05-02]